MTRNWQLVAFPLILPWRPEFWTLPLYFPHLIVGVIPGWPPELPFEGMPLPPEAEKAGRELRDYHPGELLQWQAFLEFQQSQEETADIIRQLRGEPPAPMPEGPVSGDPWALAWQLEKMQADQEAQMVLVDQGQVWLSQILRPEPWESPQGFEAAPGLSEMADPEMARLRYLLWQQVMKPHLVPPWAPFLLGRTSRAMFAALQEPAAWQKVSRVRCSLPGCRSAQDWQKIAAHTDNASWPAEFRQRLSACLEATGEVATLKAQAQELNAWLATVAAAWPMPVDWWWDLEIWTAGPEPEHTGPVLCWLGAGADILPG